MTADLGMTNGRLRVTTDLEQTNEKKIERNLTSALEVPAEEEEEEELMVAQRQIDSYAAQSEEGEGGERERERERESTCR